jgi:hypothetical protein
MLEAKKAKFQGGPIASVEHQVFKALQATIPGAVEKHSPASFFHQLPRKKLGEVLEGLLIFREGNGQNQKTPWLKQPRSPQKSPLHWRFHMLKNIRADEKVVRSPKRWGRGHNIQFGVLMKKGVDIAKLLSQQLSIPGKIGKPYADNFWMGGYIRQTQRLAKKAF